MKQADFRSECYACGENLLRKRGNHLSRHERKHQQSLNFLNESRMTRSSGARCIAAAEQLSGEIGIFSIIDAQNGKYKHSVSCRVTMLT